LKVCPQSRFYKLIALDRVGIVVVGGNDRVDLKLGGELRNEGDWVAVEGDERVGSVGNFLDGLLDELNATVLFVGELVENRGVVNEREEDLIVRASGEFERRVVAESEVAAEPNEGFGGHLEFYTNLNWICCLLETRAGLNCFRELTGVLFAELVSGFPRFFDVGDEEAVAAVARDVLLSEDIAGVEGGDSDLCELAGEVDSALFGDFEIFFDQVFCAWSADSEDHPRFDDGELGNEPFAAGFGFLRGRRTVLGFTGAPIGGAALNGVADIDFGAIETVIRKGLIEHLARAAHERASSFVFLVAGAFSDEHERAFGVAFTEYDVGAAFVEWAFCASGCGLFELLELGHVPGL
jgi:hypothetical protein